jgi:hypothetical protein
MIGINFGIDVGSAELERNFNINVAMGALV